MQNARPEEREQVTVAEETLETYVGEYEMAPEADTKFFVKTSPTQLTFQKNAKGSVFGLILSSGKRAKMMLKKVK